MPLFKGGCLKSQNGKSLQFACECVSAQSGYSDPWAAVAQHKLLPNGTKEAIVNLVAQEPRTIAQLAKELNLSAPSVHTHISEMAQSELLRESVIEEKRHPGMRYYEPNFPVVRTEDQAALDEVCEELAKRVADLFERRSGQLEQAFNQTSLPAQGWEFSDLTQYLYSRVQRGARQLLEERRVLKPAERHKNKLEWVFWAQEAGEVE
jgi:DNA-binding transcriptional ArsR family regulator